MSSPTGMKQSRGDDILQPGRVDGGTDPANSIGTLHDFERLQFCAILTCPDNRIDAAIALTSSDNLGTSTPADGYGEPRTGTTSATLGQAVQKYGRTTGLTTGLVSGINATINVNYNKGTVRFVDQILISEGASAKAETRDLWSSLSRAAETTGAGGPTVRGKQYSYHRQPDRPCVGALRSADRRGADVIGDAEEMKAALGSSPRR